MTHEEQTKWASLVAEAYSLYALLRYEMGPDADSNPLVRHAYARYRRRVEHLHTSRPWS